MGLDLGAEPHQSIPGAHKLPLHIAVVQQQGGFSSVSGAFFYPYLGEIKRVVILSGYMGAEEGGGWIPELFSGQTLVPGQGFDLLLLLCSGLRSGFRKTQELHTGGTFHPPSSKQSFAILETVSRRYARGGMGCDAQSFAGAWMIPSHQHRWAPWLLHSIPADQCLSSTCSSPAHAIINAIGTHCTPPACNGRDGPTPTPDSYVPVSYREVNEAGWEQTAPLEFQQAPKPNHGG